MREKIVNMKKASSYYFVGNLLNKGMSFFTVPIFTRMLNTSDYGIVTTYNSWIAILSMIIGFALHSGIRIAFVDYRDKMKDFMATTTAFTLFSGGVISVIALFLSHFINTTRISTGLIVICLFHSIASALIQDYSMYLMMQYRYKFRTAIMILPNLVSVILSIIAIKFVLTDKLYLGRIIPTAVTFMLFGVCICVLVFSKSKCIYNKEYLKYALGVSMPLILHGIALNILSQSDRTMITWLADSSQTGIYSLIYNFSMIATVITTSLEGIWVPWFYGHMAKKDIDGINVRAKDYITLMTTCMIGIILIGPEIVKVLASPSYLDGIVIIPPIVLSNFIIFSYTLYVNIEHYHKKTKSITLNTVIAAIINLGLNYMLIPRFGYIAAAYTTLISYLISFLLHSINAKTYEPLLYPIRYFALPMLELSVVTALFYAFIGVLWIRWGIGILFAIMTLLAYSSRIYFYFPNFEKIIRKRR